MVITKIKEICSCDRIRVVHLPCGTSLTKKDVVKKRHHCTSSKETLLIIEAKVTCDEKYLSL